MFSFRTPFFLAAMATGVVACGAQAPPGTTATSPGSTDAPLTAHVDTTPLQAAESLRVLDEEAGSTTASATTNDAGPVGIVPITPGFNASIGTTSQHDSASGWSSILTPNLAYRFNRHFSANVGVPVYTYINIYGIISRVPATRTAAEVDTYGFRTHKFLLGDTDLAGAFEAHPAFFDYNVTTTLGLPTGDDDNGLGAGQVTYNINNHFEKPIGSYFTPDLELGIGDSPNLDDTRVRKSYIDVGTNAHFQLGVNLQLPFNISFSSDAYEDLPLSTQTVTSTTTNGKKGKQLKVVTTTSSKSVGEDNGFINTLDIPLSRHVTLSGFYNRSLRNKIDTGGFSLTFLLRAPPRRRELVH